jgi:hypothetical protein
MSARTHSSRSSADNCIRGTFFTLVRGCEGSAKPTGGPLPTPERLRQSAFTVPRLRSIRTDPNGRCSDAGSPVGCTNIRLSSDLANPLSGSRNSWADGDGCDGLHLMHVSCSGGLKGVTVCTVGSEPWRGSLSDRILIAENRCAALFVSTVSPARRLCAGYRPPARNADPHPYMDKPLGPGPEGSRLRRGPERRDRVPLGRGSNSQVAASGGGPSSPAGSPDRRQYPCGARGQVRNRDGADRVCDRARPGQGWPRCQPQPAGRQRHWCQLVLGGTWAKQLGLLRELRPGAARIAVLADPKFPGTERVVSELQAAVSAIGQLMPVSSKWHLGRGQGGVDLSNGLLKA